ncbi:MAG TPA: tripartite tricarboxylate transporter substrate-binding protein [Xanthobacteraceae bacterium]|nr:tripartite tricarboxylate transporter substrate-binding protein [Xanthobacteraceae bacterium]
MRPHSLLRVLALAFCLAGPRQAALAADDYPNRPITVVVPFAAGGASDVVARIVTEHMSRTLGQSMVIENVGGAGGTLGSARVASASPDGYTLLAGSMGSHVAAPVLTPNIKYDPKRDFAAIGPTAHAPAVIVARKDFPAKTLSEFIAYLKESGPKVRQAHGGVGASSHMACLLFAQKAGVNPTPVAYRGSNLGMNDMIGGHVDYLCEQSVSVSKQVTSGAVKAYAVAAAQRLAALPEVPTAKEQGLDYEMSIWAGIFAPAATPAPIIAKLSDALDKALEDPGVRDLIDKLGGSVPARAERKPEVFAAYVRDEIARWEPILKTVAQQAK